MNMKKKCTLLIVLSFTIPAFSFPELSNYLENDLQLKKLSLEVSKAEYSRKENSIDNGLTVKLSTGTATFTTDNDMSYVSFKPSVSAKIPQLQNTSVSLSSTIKINGDKNVSQDTKLSLSADIISGNALTLKLSKMKAERTLLKAKRNLQNRAIEVEKEYYSELKKLLEAYSSIVQNQNSLYEDTIDFEEIKAKGFSTGSAKYRQAELKVISDNHNIETKLRKLEHDCAVFSSKCGQSFDQNQKISDFLPVEILKVDAVNVYDFSKNNYTKIEEAEYTHSINSLERKADINFTLSANTGYTFENSNSKNSDSSFSDTIDAGLSAGISGISGTAGISLPVNNDNKNPIYTLSATLDPNSFRKRQITQSKYKINEEQELIDIQSACEDYQTILVDQENSLRDINWSKISNTETFDMYSNLEADFSKHFKAGLITESQYLSAFSNKELYRIKLLIDDIDLIIYNNTTKLLFCRDNEIQG